VNGKEYIRYLLSNENYSFSLDEITQHTNGIGTSLKFELVRLINKKEIINLRKGFYLIIPPRYSKQGQLPIQVFIDKLFESLKRNYYVGFYSAAKFYGASHQQSQREYIMTEKPKLNDIRKNSLDIRFLTTARWPDKNILLKKSDAGCFKISSPALTAVDLIHHQNKLGGLNRVLTILEELTEEINQKDIIDLLSWYPYKSSLQRLGFLLEKITVDKNLFHPIKNHLHQLKIFPVLLSPNASQKPGAIDNYWKIDVNRKLESDL
jgi:predicted transcriptional regulator of viral defense system